METECTWVLIVPVLACRTGTCLAHQGGSPLSGHADGDLLGAQEGLEPLPVEEESSAIAYSPAALG